MKDLLNKIVLGDCLDVMKGIPDKSVDLVLTDPPFGLITDEPIEKVLQCLSECNRISKRMAVLMDYRNNWAVDSLFQNIKIGELVWEYGWISGGRSKAKSGFFPTHNTIGLYGDKKSFNFIKGSIIKGQKGFYSPRQCSFAKKTGHPYEKPIKLIEYLLLGCSQEDDIILDPFSGSGTLAIASINTNRKFICIEKDPEYHRLATERVEKEKLNLFNTGD